MHVRPPGLAPPISHPKRVGLVIAEQPTAATMGPSAEPHYDTDERMRSGVTPAPQHPTTLRVLPKILFTTPSLEHPPAGGPHLRVENTIKALSRVCELHVVARTGEESMGGAQAVAFYRQ